MSKKINKNRKLKMWLTLPVFFVVAFAAFFYFGAGSAHAQGLFFEHAAQELENTLISVRNGIVSGLLSLISGLLQQIIKLLGGLLSMTVDWLGAVAEYGTNGEFTDQLEVVEGWKIVRDVMNSFFIVVLIAIAIATIIRWQPFHFRQTLPRLIIAAILVNFSRTITLVAINFAASIMAFFMTELKALLPAFLLGLRAPAIASVNSSTLGRIGNQAAAEQINSFLGLIVTQFFAIIILLLSLAVMLFTVIVLLFRVVVLWLLMILSPLAFFLWGTPGRANNYWGEWLNEFIKHVLIGPVMLFFLYLDVLFFLRNLQLNYAFAVPQRGGGVTATVISDPRILFSYVISIALMLASIEIAQKLGVRGGSFAKSLTTDKLGAFGKRIARGLTRGAKSATLGTLGYARDRAYAGLSGTTGLRYLAPLVKPAYTLGQAREGLRRRQQKFVQRGDENLAEAAKTAARGRVGRIRAAALGVGSAEAWENKGAAGYFGEAITSQIKDSVLSKYYSGLRPEQETLSQIENRDKARAAFDSLSEADRVSVSGMTRADLKANINNLNLGKTVADLSEQSVAGTAEEQAEAAQKLATLAQQHGGIGNLQAAYQNYESNPEQLEAFSSLDKALGEEGVAVEDSTNLGAAAANLYGGKSSDDKTKAGLTKLAAARTAEGQVYASAAQAKLDARITEYRKSTYDPETEYPPSEIGARAQSHFNAGDIGEFTGDLMQAAKQGGGDIGQVLKGLDAEFTMDTAGMEKFFNAMVKKGISKEQAAFVVKKIERENKSGGRSTQTGYVKRDEQGQWRPASKEEQRQAVYKKAKGQNFTKLARDGKMDAFGTYDSKKDKLAIHDGVKQAIDEMTDAAKAEMIRKISGEAPKAVEQALRGITGITT